MTFKSFFIGMGIGILSLFIIIIRIYKSINTPNKLESPTQEKLEKQVKHLEKKKDAEQSKTIIKKINKESAKRKEALNEETISNLIDRYNSKSDD